jgi:hypothetical protein
VLHRHQPPVVRGGVGGQLADVPLQGREPVGERRVLVEPGVEGGVADALADRPLLPRLGRLHHQLAHGPLLAPEHARDRPLELPVGGQDGPDRLQPLDQQLVAAHVAEVEELDAAAQDLHPPQVLGEHEHGVAAGVLLVGRVARCR